MKTTKDCKQETKALVEQEIERYYDEFEKASADQTKKIGDFERLVMEHKTRLDDILRDMAGKVLSRMETEVKKMP